MLKLIGDVVLLSFGLFSSVFWLNVVELLIDYFGCGVCSVYCASIIGFCCLLVDCRKNSIFVVAVAVVSKLDI